MKKILVILLFSFGLVGCSSIDLNGVISDMPSSNSETARILALGLTHEESLNEAGKIKESNMYNAVIGKLQKAEDKKNKDILDNSNAIEYAKNVKIIETDSEVKFESSLLSESKRIGILDEYDYHDYHFVSIKNKNTGLIQHKLQLSIKYKWKKLRNYSSASFCDKWQGCEDSEKIAINLISSSASSCAPSECEYIEIVQLNLSDDFLRNNIEKGFSVSFNSKKATNKIVIATDYMKGYFQVVK